MKKIMVLALVLMPIVGMASEKKKPEKWLKNEVIPANRLVSMSKRCSQIITCMNNDSETLCTYFDGIFQNFGKGTKEEHSSLMQIFESLSNKKNNNIAIDTNLSNASLKITHKTGFWYLKKILFPQYLEIEKNSPFISPVKNDKGQGRQERWQGIAERFHWECIIAGIDARKQLELEWDHHFNTTEGEVYMRREDVEHRTKPEGFVVPKEGVMIHGSKVTKTNEAKKSEKSKDESGGSTTTGGFLVPKDSEIKKSKDIPVLESPSGSPTSSDDD